MPSRFIFVKSTNYLNKLLPQFFLQVMDNASFPTGVQVDKTKMTFETKETSTP